jgi:Tfp pilus assembly PilM family ATPase
VVFGKALEQSPIGLDVGDAGARWVRAAQRLTGRRGGAAVRTARLSRSMGVAAGAGGDELTPRRIATLMDALERQGFVGRRVVLSLPQKMLLSAVLDVPPRSSGAPLDVICRNELARTHRLEPEMIEAGWWDLPPAPASAGSAAANAGPQAIAVGCRVSDAEDLIARFEEADVTVCGIDCRCAALARGALPAAAPPPGLTAIVEWECAAALVVVVRGETILYERHLPEAGLASLRSNVAKKLAIEADVAGFLVEDMGLGRPGPELAEDAEMVGHAQRLIGEWIDSMVLEVRASAAYASRRFGDAVERIVLAGTGAEIAGVPERVREKSEIELASVDALPAECGGGIRDGSRPSAFVVAMGLSAMPAEVLA